MTKRNLVGCAIVCSAMMFAAACGDDTTPGKDAVVAKDAGADAPSIDAKQPQPDAVKGDTNSLEDAKAADVAMTDTAKGDAVSTDAAKADAVMTDAATADTSVGVDAAASLAGNVMYLTHTSTTTLAPTQIKLDGTGKTAVSGLPTSIDPLTLTVRGVRGEYGVVNPDRPAAWQDINAYYRPVRLPGSLGHLYYYKTATGRGYFVVRPTGKVAVLDFFAGTSSKTSTYYSTIGVNRAGTIVAAVAGYDNTAGSTVKLLRTDGNNFGTTSSGVCDITPAATPKITYVRYNSFAFGEKYFYFVTRDTASTAKYYLYKAPLDCSAKASKVSLPQVGGLDSTSIEAYLHQTEDGKKIVALAGSGTTKREVMVIDDAAGTITNLSESPGDYKHASTYFGYNTGRMDITPKGTYVAYTKYQLSYELYLRPTSKASAAIHLTAPANFASDYDYIGGVQFVSEDDLLFWVGTQASHFDLFHYKISTKALTQITKSGGTTKPYTGVTTEPTMTGDGGWFSPNGKYYYQIAAHYKTGTSTTADLLAIDRATGAVKNLTTNQFVYRFYNLQAAETGGKVFFHMEGSEGSNKRNLYVFDQNTASAPVKLTNFTGTSYIDDITPNKDGSLVAFAQGAAIGTQDLYVVQVSATPAVKKLTTTSGNISDMKWFTSDSKHIVYGVGTASGRADLRVQPIAGGAAKVLHATTGYTSAIMLW